VSAASFPIPWGLWSRSGWIPNLKLAMSADEQYRLNLANGLLMEPGLRKTGTTYAGDQIVSKPQQEARS
jgi:hypothetical protein